MEVTTEAITEAAREAATGRPPSPQTVWAVTRAGVVQNTRREPEKHGLVCPRSALFLPAALVLRSSCGSSSPRHACFSSLQTCQLSAPVHHAALYGAAELATHGAAVDEQPPLPD